MGSGLEFGSPSNHQTTPNQTNTLRDDPPALRFIRSCSASLAASVLERLEASFHAPVLEAYAMTENAHQVGLCLFYSSYTFIIF